MSYADEDNFLKGMIFWAVVLCGALFGLIGWGISWSDSRHGGPLHYDYLHEELSPPIGKRAPKPPPPAIEACSSAEEGCHFRWVRGLP